MKKRFLNICLMGFILFGTSSCTGEHTEDGNSPKVHESKEISALKKVNSFQKRYFKIIQRNDVLLSDYIENIHTKDSLELVYLFKEVEAEIEKNNSWFKEYLNIEEKFKSNKGETLYDMDEFERKHNKELNYLLSSIYKFLKTKLTAKEFRNLKVSQKKWIKHVRIYRKTFNSKELGSMREIKKLNCEINMRKFRILLLITFLQKSV